MNALLSVALLALAVTVSLLLRLRSVYAQVRRSFRATARDLDLTYREFSAFRPQLFGQRRGKTLIVELAGRRFAPDSIRVIWADRVHTRAGLAITPELVDELVNLLADTKEFETERSAI